MAPSYICMWCRLETCGTCRADMRCLLQATSDILLTSASGSFEGNRLEILHTGKASIAWQSTSNLGHDASHLGGSSPNFVYIHTRTVPCKQRYVTSIKIGLPGLILMCKCRLYLGKLVSLHHQYMGSASRRTTFLTSPSVAGLLGKSRVQSIKLASAAKVIALMRARDSVNLERTL
jgi:hypothetical protein